MNNYLFRGKSTGDLSPWCYGYYYYDESVDMHFILDKTTLIRYEVKSETVGQWTGWKDSKDNLIWTDDRVEIEWDYDGEITCETITYSDQYGYFMYGNNPICELTDPVQKKLFVVGNIHDLYQE